MIAFFLPKYKRYLELEADTKITITATTPLADVEHLSRIYTFDFSIPVNPNNDAALRHVHRIDSRFGAQDLVCECQVGGVFVVGKLSVVDVSTVYRISFVSESRDILSELDYDLSTFAQETIHLIPPTTIPTYNEYRFRLKTGGVTGNPNAPNYGFNMGINGTSFLTSWNYYPPYLEAALQSLATQINNYTQSTMASVDNVSFLLVVKVPVDMSNGKEQFQWDYSLFSNIETHSFISPFGSINQQATITMNALNVDTNSDIVFPTVYAPNFASIDNVAFAKHINNVDSDGNMIENQYEAVKDNARNRFVPMFRVGYVLKKMANRLNLTLGGDWWKTEEAKRLIIFNTQTIDQNIEIALWNDTTEVFENKSISYVKSAIQPSAHLPNMTARAFLQTLCHDFGIFIEVKEGMLLLNKKRDIIDLLAKNRTHEIIPNTLRFVPRKDEGLKIAYNFGPETTIPTGQLQSVTINPTAKTKKTFALFGTLPMTVSTYDYTLRRVPHYFGKADEDSFGFLFYRGIQANAPAPFIDNTAAVYPYATHDDLRHDGTSIGDWSLSPSGEKGLYAVHLKGVAEIELAQEAEVELNPSVADTSLKGNYGRMFAYTPNGHFEAIPKQVRLRFSNRNLDSVSMILLIL